MVVPSPVPIVAGQRKWYLSVISVCHSSCNSSSTWRASVRNIVALFLQGSVSVGDVVISTALRPMVMASSGLDLTRLRSYESIWAFNIMAKHLISQLLDLPAV